MATMENRMSRMTIIHTTLSPSRESTKFQRVFFFFVSSAIFIEPLESSYGFLELLAAVLVAGEEVEAGAARAEQHDVS